MCYTPSMADIQTTYLNDFDYFLEAYDKEIHAFIFDKNITILEINERCMFVSTDSPYDFHPTENFYVGMMNLIRQYPEYVRSRIELYRLKQL